MGTSEPVAAQLPVEGVAGVPIEPRTWSERDRRRGNGNGAPGTVPYTTLLDSTPHRAPESRPPLRGVLRATRPRMGSQAGRLGSAHTEGSGHRRGEGGVEVAGQPAV